MLREGRLPTQLTDGVREDKELNLLLCFYPRDYVFTFSNLQGV